MLSKWRYEKYDENFKRTMCPAHDDDGSITGKVIINLKSYFDENPEERIRLGWIKHYYYPIEELEEMYDEQTQFYQLATKMIDDYTMEDYVMVFDKTEDMMTYEEIAGLSSFNSMILPF